MSFFDDGMPASVEQFLVVKLLGEYEFTTMSDSEVSNETLPSERQRQAGPGDYALKAFNSRSTLESACTPMVLVEPSEHADRFPDWENRVLASYVLAEWTDNQVDGSYLGWFARSWLMPISSEQYKELMGFVASGVFPERLEWVEALSAQFHDEMAEHREGMPTSYRCTKCDSGRTEFTVSTRIEIQCTPGLLQEDDKSVIVPLSSYRRVSNTTVKIRCSDCTYIELIEEERPVDFPDLNLDRHRKDNHSPSR